MFTLRLTGAITALLLSLPASAQFSDEWEFRSPRFKFEQSLSLYGQPITGLPSFQSRTDASAEFSVSNYTWTALATPWVWTQLPYAAGGSDQEYRAFFEMKEAWVEVANPAWDLRAGFQILAWGTADRVNPTDLINPRDYYDPLDSRKLPVVAARLQIHPVSLEGWNLQLVGLPFFRESRLPIELPDNGTAPMSLDSSRWLLPLPGSVSVSGTPTPLEYELAPATFPVTWGAGARLSASGLGGWDFSVSAYTGVEDLPRFGITGKGSTGPGLPITVTLHPSYHRFSMFGFDAAGSLSLGDETVGLRIEGAYVKRSNNRVEGLALEPSLTAAQREELRGDLTKDDFFHVVAGMDYTYPRPVFGTVLYGNLQYVHYERLELSEAVPGATVVEGLPNALPWDRSLTLYLESRFDSRFRVSNTLIASVLNRDGLVSPAFHAQWSDSLSTKIAGEVFYGPSNGFFGQFGDNSRVTLSGTFVF